MRSKLVVPASLGLAAFAVVAWVSEVGAARPSKAAKSHSETITVVEHQTSVKPAGNTITVTNDLLQNGQKTGANQVGCFLTGPGTLAVCTASSVFSKGQILSAASIAIPPPTGDTVTAIVGGTGAYGTARGTIDSVRTQGSSDANVTYHIVH